MGQVVKEGLQEENKERTNVTASPEVRMKLKQKRERTGAAEAVLARHRHKMASFIFAGLGSSCRHIWSTHQKKKEMEMKGQAVAEDAGALHHSPVLQSGGRRWRGCRSIVSLPELAGLL